MRSKRRTKWIGILLTTLLVLQLSFHTVHMLTSHSPHSDIENASHDTQTQEPTLVCDLCAKLLAPTSYLSPNLVVLITFVVVSTIIILKETSEHSQLQVVQWHRGPPPYFF